MFVSEGFQDERLVADLARAGFDACGEGIHTALLQIIRRQLAADLTNRPATNNKQPKHSAELVTKEEVYHKHVRRNHADNCSIAYPQRLGRTARRCAGHDSDAPTLDPAAS